MPFVEISRKTKRTFDAIYVIFDQILIKTMDKLFSLFIRYAIIPEKEFIQKASKMIYSMANLAEAHPARNIKLKSQPNYLNVTHNQKTILLQVEPTLRQLFYNSSVSGEQKFSMVGTRWINN